MTIRGIENRQPYGRLIGVCPIDPVPAIKYGVLLNPLTYISEGLRGVLIPNLPHMPLPAVLAALTVITLVFWRLGLRAFMKRAVG